LNSHPSDIVCNQFEILVVYYLSIILNHELTALLKVAN